MKFLRIICAVCAHQAKTSASGRFFHADPNADADHSGLRRLCRARVASFCLSRRLLVNGLAWLTLLPVWALGADPHPGYTAAPPHEAEIAPGWTAQVTVFEESDAGDSKEKPAIVEIRSRRQEKDVFFRWSDPDPDWPVYEISPDWAGRVAPPLISLKEQNVLWDVDHDGVKEILLFGTSCHGGSGLVGRCVVIGWDGAGAFKVKAIFAGTDSFDFWYDVPSTSFLVIQYLWRMGKEAHYGDLHACVFKVFDPARDPAPWTLDFSKKKYSDEDELPIAELITDLRRKLEQVRAGILPPDRTAAVVRFAKDYWAAVSAKDLPALRRACADELFFYSRVMPVEAALAEKKKLLDRFGKMTFTCSNFVVYRLDERVVVEYDKEYAADAPGQGGKVRSVLELRETPDGYRVVAEKDAGIYHLERDIP